MSTLWQIEPAARGAGPRLHLIATARIRLKEPFGLEGPLGPLPAADTLVIYLDFFMRPVTLED